MGEKETLERIHKVAEQEFLQKGFKGASLRNIVKNAGVTTGAFYGYYESKEELFDALVRPHGEYLISLFKDTLKEFKGLPDEEQVVRLEEYSAPCLDNILEYSYEHLTGMKLLLSASVGTRYENFVHEMVETEIQCTHDYMQVLKRLGKPVHEINSYFEHTIVSGMFTAYFELIIHDVPYEQAKECADEIYKFYSAGWAACMELN